MGNPALVEVVRGGLVESRHCGAIAVVNTEDRRVRAIRLFKEKEGWTPKYIENGVHAEYAPVCWGPAYIPVSPGALKTTVGA